MINLHSIFNEITRKEETETQRGVFLKVYLETPDKVGMVGCLHLQNGSTDIAGEIGDVGGEDVSFLIGTLHFLVERKLAQGIKPLQIEIYFI